MSAKRIALDAMAGDFGPEPLVLGAIRAVQETRHSVVLVGNASKIEEILNREQALHPRLSIVHSETVVGMGESPTKAIKKRDSSLAVAVDLVKRGEADAIVSAGNTGAALAMSVLRLRTLPGIARPAIGAVLPIPGHPRILLDVGANAECKPQHLADFAVMGAIYAREILHRKSPRVGLLNIGEEETKGNDLVIGARRIVEKLPLNFIGNVEGRDICRSNVDVIVCDGFVGNVVLKSLEGMATMMFSTLKHYLTRDFRSKMGAALVKPSLMEMKKHLDADEYGAAPLLGVNGIAMIAHGSADANAIKNAIRSAGECARHDINAKVQAVIKKDGKHK